MNIYDTDYQKNNPDFQGYNPEKLQLTQLKEIIKTDSFSKLTINHFVKSDKYTIHIVYYIDDKMCEGVLVTQKNEVRYFSSTLPIYKQLGLSSGRVPSIDFLFID